MFSMFTFNTLLILACLMLRIFIFGGRLIFGPDARSVGLTICLIVIPVAIFCGFVGRKLVDHLGISVVIALILLTILVLGFLLITSGRDPGIVPRNLHPPEPDDYDGSTDAGETPQSRFPRVKEVLINRIIVKVKYCDTCMLYRPPRCSPCSICDNCVQRFDHHCPWVGQCIGLRKYRFFMFVLSATLLCIYVQAFCWVYVKMIMNSEDISIWKALIKTPASIVLIIYSFLASWFVGCLTCFHSYLISQNQSTYENFRYRYDGRANPYNKGVTKNFMEVFCTSIPPSQNNFREKVPINPAQDGNSFDGPIMGKAISDIEMGKTPGWDKTDSEAGDYRRQFCNDDDDDEGKDNKFNEADVSSDLSRTLPTESTDSHSAALHPSRRSSWGRRSGSLNLSPEVVAMAAGVGDSWRVMIESVASLRQSPDNNITQVLKYPNKEDLHILTWSINHLLQFYI